MGMWALQTLSIDDALERIDKNMWELQCYAEFRAANKEFELPQRGRYANIKAAFNAMDSSLARMTEAAKKLPREKKVSRTGVLAEEADNDPGEVFQELLQPFVDKMLEIAEQVGSDVYDQVLAFEEAFEAQVDIISYAASVSMPSREELVEKCKPLTETADEAVEYNRECEVHDPLKAHFQAVADLSTMLGWVVAPSAVKHVKEFQNVVELECNNILSNFIRLDCNPIHSDYAETIRSLCKQLHEYVAEQHPAGLRWNYMKGAAPEGYRVKRKVKARKDAHPFLDFLEIIDGPLLEYFYHSQLLGEEVESQAKLLFNAFIKQYELITRAAQGQKVADANAMRMYVMPIMYEIAEVVSAADGVDREHNRHLHLKVVAEVAQVLSWVISTETTAAMYATELSGASELHLNRLVQRLEGNSSLHFHKLWVESLRTLLNDMKVYVNVHHYKELSFDTKHTQEEIPGLWRQRERSVKIRQMKTDNKGKTRHWTPEMQYLWGTGIIDRPLRNTKAARRMRIK